MHVRVCSAAKAVQRATLTLQRVHDVHRRDGLATCVFRVRDSITNHVLQEHLEHSARLLVNEVRDALHAATTSETTNRWLRDTLRTAQPRVSTNVCCVLCVRALLFT